MSTGPEYDPVTRLPPPSPPKYLLKSNTAAEFYLGLAALPGDVTINLIVPFWFISSAICSHLLYTQQGPALAQVGRRTDRNRVYNIYSVGSYVVFSTSLLAHSVAVPWQKPKVNTDQENESKSAHVDVFLWIYSTSFLQNVFVLLSGEFAHLMWSIPLSCLPIKCEATARRVSLSLAWRHHVVTMRSEHPVITLQVLYWRNKPGVMLYQSSTEV